ncbi:hypothetical protein Kpol_538p24 [Vanderwaltozyma polyspora DSM 70294]|uniref:Uncharacterized protein n=1 Tax=Vanderwaltozyma polyspora (strain ATCC 22028 / DSM 70294 / BCRC 21397 / CBS 2163 / NBRC 10782 / NRRL Y-8283 / UCD 57-17) TaxID=436907 RepID=A7TKD7_VANPO|nr:uncharacterized protein Kpol_538p24 [Vanderwaltozyma polyspora DSM 70294]EDO17264.1 hypothetical protein Kpol_538p24 [Vanderwaltozyma polyspora DSM 70294]
MVQNKHISRLIRYVMFDSGGAGGNGGRDSVFGCIAKVLKRLRSVSLVSVVILLIKLRKTPYNYRSHVLKVWLRNAGSIGLLSSVSPIVNKILSFEINGVSVGDDKFKRFVSWNAAVCSFLLVVTKVPNWITSYVAIESISDSIYNLPRVHSFIENCDEKLLNSMRQVFFCFLIPILDSKVSKDNRGSQFLFGKRTLIKDFLIFLAIWDFLSLFNMIKSFFIKSKDSNTVPDVNSKNNKNIHNDEKPLISSNLKPLFDKLNEIQELTNSNNFSLFEKFMNSYIIKNILPSMKWAVWRQLVLYLFVKNNKLNKKNAFAGCTNLMKSIILVFGFLIVDGNANLNVRPGVLRFFIRSILTNKLNKIELEFDNFHNFVFLLSSQLAFYNYNNSDSSSSSSSNSNKV